MNKIFVDKFKAPFGKITIISSGNNLQKLVLADITEWEINPDSITEEFSAWLDLYFKGKNPEVPDFSLGGTFFQNMVWNLARLIPWGATRTYGEIAKKISLMTGNGMAPRAVGNALNRNPYPLLIPCHRVVSATTTGGFAYGKRIKDWLLNFERG